MTGLVLSSETFLIILTIDSNMFFVFLAEFLAHIIDDLDTARSTGSGCGVVAVGTCTVPVTGKRFGMERDFDTEFFSNSDKKETGHPEMVTHGDAFARTDLEFPLGGHDFGVDTGDLYTGIETSTVMSFYDVTGKNFASTDTTIVGTLGAGISAFGPAIGSVFSIEESVFLLDAEPRFVGSSSVHILFAFIAMVGSTGKTVGVIGFSNDDNVIITAEGVFKNGCRTEIDIRVASAGLCSGRAVKVPFGKVVYGCNLFVKGLDATKSMSQEREIKTKETEIP